MPAKTKIEWADYTSNPIKLRKPDGSQVNACVKISEGCKNCYAESITKHYWPKAETQGGKRFPGYSLPLLQRGEIVLDEREIRRMLTFKPKPPYKSPDGRPKVFVCDMSDMYGEWVPDQMLDKLFAVFALRPDVDWLVLTKREERMADYVNELVGGRRNIGVASDGMWPSTLASRIQVASAFGVRFGDGEQPLRPFPNVWLGVSVENQATADERIPHLLRCPAAIHFVSYEPALGPVDFTPWLHALDWVIVGGESQ